MLAAGALGTVVALGARSALGSGADSGLLGDPLRGRQVYQRCMGCHSLDEDDIGPHHRGVVGRRAGTVAGYAYSAALSSSGLVWDRDTLDRWLANPGRLVPGARMFFSLPDARDRADVIAYLALQR